MEILILKIRFGEKKLVFLGESGSGKNNFNKTLLLGLYSSKQGKYFIWMIKKNKKKY